MDLATVISIAISVTLLLLVVALAFGPILGWRLAPKQKASIKFLSAHVPRAKIRAAIAELGWTLVRDQPGDMLARTRVSWRSWGEIVSIEFHIGGAEIESRSSSAFQAVDWGKNRMNVQHLVETLQKSRA